MTNPAVSVTGLTKTYGSHPVVAVNRAAIGEGIVLAELAVRRPDLEAHYLSRVEGTVR